MAEGIRIDDKELRERLTREQFHVTQQAGTERPFTGVYWDAKDEGVYRCVVCSTPLFRSEDKYDSGTGWPSFTQPIDEDAVEYVRDSSGFMVRTEARCASCSAHLGHVFDDGPGERGQRYCMNSASLDLEAADLGATD
jgi:peptide-methionine (R)-S-oxide reductase